jgi:Holin of 3TMs, for gene-transfer release
MAGFLDFLGPIESILNKVLPDTGAKDAAKAQLQLLAAQGQLQEDLIQLQAVTGAQTDINKIEAASTNWFVAGARPAIMWICALALALTLIIGPFFTWLTALLGHPTPFPALDNNLLMALMFPLLGLGAYRTVEKIQGVAGNH